MNNHYIYKFNYTEKESGVDTVVSATVIFCDRDQINQITLAAAIKKFYEHNAQSDKIFVIARIGMEAVITKTFVEELDTTFKGIPKRQETHLIDNLFLATFKQSGDLNLIYPVSRKIPTGFLKNYINEGLQSIFISRGGLISSSGSSHHYVFPSGKHCDKFLRTGNILLFSSEIYFIAFSLLKHFDFNQHTQIYCDTSTINSIAFALTDLVNRFQKEENRKQIPIESFSSYDGLYKNDLGYKKNAFLLISASTSANIINYILENHSEIERKNIVVLYYLGKDRSLNIADKIACNLTFSKTNPNGIISYPTFKSEDCEFCQRGSVPVEVKGYSFLLEQPKINRILFNIKDPDRGLSKFVEQFKSQKKSNTILKVHYKENSNDKYEIYIDYSEILNGVQNNRYESYRAKLNAYINQYIPSNTKYIVHLEDTASKDLANYILSIVEKNYLQKNRPKKIAQDQLNQIDKGSEGAVVVVGSCITNGKNLLYISRALRNYHSLRIIYFVGITRTKNKEFLDNLKKNLKQGTYGSESSTFIEVESIFCENTSKKSSWSIEIEFLKDFISYLKNNFANNSKTSQQYLFERKNKIETGGGNKSRGLSEDIFYARVVSGKYQPLRIRKNFAFFDFSNYVDDVTQSEIYYTISSIINSLRTSDKTDRNLRQTAYVRNIIEPGNFNRFNDGIIQASILRAAKSDELIYSIDADLSSEMRGILQTVIKYHKEEQGEALLEFLYAIASKKMSLKRDDLITVINTLENECTDKIFIHFGAFIRARIIESENTKNKRTKRAKNTF
ncbi:hypothetical protein [Dawidia soli]|uniref:Uncharacterized protein n=1 Tax=Dawidia soli TaxID=2782352 RepID=A0AAP2DDG8_9BACT|nr:hypothetical protein [Dawidia soli]MBT1687387.1 hypothetical protein [Dawidia soli]